MEGRRAGVSANSGLPNWNELIKPFREDLSLKNAEISNPKIAQFYYDTWGKQEYIQKILDIFNEYSNAQPNKIHDYIAKIQPKHIITTNFDNLIEDSINKGVVKYNVIKKNLDIPYSNGNSYIIKMHGDLENKNIVLKENDYLDYEKNFNMVSTLIQSLIMNNTVLFIGYSLGDSTFNSIFRLIHNSLGDNSKKSYFYTVNTPEAPIIEYYEKKGIQVLSSGKKNISKKLIGKYTENFLETISTEKNPKTSNETEIWHAVKFLNRLSFIESQDVVKNTNLKDPAFLYHSDCYSYEDMNKQMVLTKKSDLNILLSKKTSVNTFLGNEIKHPQNFNNNDTLYTAYMLYQNNQYSEAKVKFRQIANEAYKRKDYFNFLIAEFNVSHIYDRLLNPNQLEEKPYDIEFSEMLDRIIESSQEDMKKLAIFLRDNIFNFQFIYKKISKLDTLLDKLKSERLTYKNGGSSDNSDLSTLKFEFNQFLAFIDLNCICIFQYRAFKLIVNRYIEGLLIALDNSNYPGDEINFFGPTSSIITELKLEDIQKILPHIDVQMLSVYLDNYSVSKIKITNTALEYIIKTATQLCETATSSFSPSYTLLKKYIGFLSLVEIKINNNLIDLLEKYPIFSDNQNEIRIIIQILIRKSDEIHKKDEDRIVNFINKTLEQIIKNNYTLHFSTFNLYATLLKQLNISNEQGVLSIPSINSKLEFIDKIDFNPKAIEKYQLFLIYFYKFLDVKQRKLIDHILLQYSELPENELNISFIIPMILADIIDFNTNKKVVFDKLIQTITTPPAEGFQTYPDPLKQAVSDIFNLAQHGYFSFNEILESKIDKNIIGQFPEIDWILFNKKDDKTISGMVQNHTYSELKKYFIRSNEDLKILNNWIIKQFKNGNLKLD